VIVMILKLQHRIRRFGVVYILVGAGLATRAALGQVPPANDDCANAEMIQGIGAAGVFQFDNASAVLDGPDHAACSYAQATQIDHDVWFCWTAPDTPCSENYIIETCGQTSIDTRLAVYDGCTCPPTDAGLLDCSDDDCGSNGFQTRLTLAATPGQQYLIRVGTYPGQQGGVGSISIDCPSIPDNDDCQAAEFISGEGLFDFNTALATTDGNAHTDCIFAFEDQIIKDVWFCWEAPCDGTVFAETCGMTDIDSKLAVYDGCACPVGDETLLACNDDRCGPYPYLQSRIAFEAVAGQSYLLRVGAYPQASTLDEQGGPGSLELSCGLSACPGAGSCFAPNGSPGCDDQACCERVCEIDSVCCDVAWDDYCQAEAEGLCGGNFTACGGAGTLECDVANTIPGCADSDCCNAVCAVDPYCCTNAWDADCAKAEPLICRSTCGPGAGGCFVANGSPGCEIEACCREVCLRDPFCCSSISSWDSACAESAATHCGNLPQCPAGDVQWIDPPNGVVDARYPVDPTTETPLGIDTVQVQGPKGAAAACFSLCETQDGGSPNSIVDVLEVNEGGAVSTYTISLARPITPAAVTTITYTDDQNVSTTATFTAHPANVNGDSATGASDVLAMIDYLNGVDQAVNGPWGDYSVDVDHSGAIGAADVLAVIDLLNGAGIFDPWANTPLPTNGGICP